MIYFEDGEVIAESGRIKVYRMGNDLFLEKGPGHNLWIDTLENEDLNRQIGDFPRGNCLELGLGLGMASRHILSRPNVDLLTTVEIDPDVIEVHVQLNGVNNKHIIVNMDAIKYLEMAKDKFDFIFMDHYSIIDEDTLDDIEYSYNLAKKLLTENGKVIAWFDSYTPVEFADKFFEIIEN